MIAPRRDARAAGPEVECTPMALEREREQVAAASRRLAAERLVLGTAGNGSARSGERVAITPTGAVLAELEPEQVSVVEMDSGELVDGALEPTSEIDLHLGVYRRYGAGAVVHTHAPMATAIACVLDELPLVHYQMLALGGAVRVAPYATFGTPELAEGVVKALEGRSAALMRSHGAVTVGADAAGASEATLLLEWACNVYWHARALGEPHLLTDDEVNDVVAAVTERGYGAVKEIG
jgi:L-fuculose-phosphate aldolase